MRDKGLWKTVASNRRGAAAALVALGMPVLLGMVALGVDLGMMFSARAEAQRAADSGALAGAAMFREYPLAADAVAPAIAEATSFTTSNFIRDGQVGNAEITAEANPAVEMVRVTVTRSIPTWFAQIFGVNDVTIAVEAVAEAATADTPQEDCILPFAVPDLWLSDGNEDSNSNDIWEFNPNMNGSNNAEHDPGEIWFFDSGSNGETYGDGDGEFGPTPTGWGTAARNTKPDAQNRRYTNDYGRQLPIKLDLPKNSPTPSFWYTWVIPGASNPGMEGVRDAINNCGTNAPNVSVGDSVEWDVETKNGLMGNPTWSEMKEVIEGDDPNAYWEETCTGGVCTGEIKGTVHGDGSHASALEHSKRVFTVAIFHPADQSSGKQHMRFIDFARVFMEPLGDSFKNDITARFLGFLPGASSSDEEAGTNIKILRLIDEDLWVPVTPPTTAP